MCSVFSLRCFYKMTTTVLLAESSSRRSHQPFATVNTEILHAPQPSLAHYPTPLEALDAITPHLHLIRKLLIREAEMPAGGQDAGAHHTASGP